MNLKDLHAETLDGHRVEVCGNIGTVKDCDGILRNGGEGVGLYVLNSYLWIIELYQLKKNNTKLTKEVAEAMEGQGYYPYYGYRR